MRRPCRPATEKVTLASPAIASGGSSVSASSTDAPRTVSVQRSPRGRDAPGARAKVVWSAEDAVTAIALPSVHASAKASAPAVTGSEKVTASEPSGATPPSPFAGSVLATAGAASPGAALHAGSPLEAPGVIAASRRSLPFSSVSQPSGTRAMLCSAVSAGAPAAPSACPGTWPS